MNGIKGIGFELKDGSDYEGPFPILTGQTIDLNTIQAIDYYRDNPLVQKAVKELAAAMPEMEVLGADANQQEALFLIDDATYLHIQPCDSGWDYTLYDAASMKELDGGRDVYKRQHAGRRAGRKLPVLLLYPTATPAMVAGIMEDPA